MLQKIPHMFVYTNKGFPKLKMVPKKSQFSPNFCLCGAFLRKVPNSKACIRTPVCDFGLVLPGGGPVNKNPVCTFVANMLHLITKNAGIFFNQN